MLRENTQVILLFSFGILLLSMGLMKVLTLAFCVVSLTASSQQNIQKFSPSIQSYLFRPDQKNQDSLEIVIALKENTSFTNKKLKLGFHYTPSNVFAGKIAVKDLQLLSQDSNIVFVDRLRKPEEELTSGAIDFSLNKIKFTQYKSPAFNGAAIATSIKEQSFDTADIDFKGRIILTPTSGKTTSSHASIMTTIIGGGGNSSTNAKGVAWASNLSSSDFTSLLPDADTVYTKYNISVQNHSYGTGIENFYGADASAYDMNVWRNRSLVHVFSAGNSGSATADHGLYQGVQGFANLTGSFKMAKNIITVGHVDSFNKVLPLSSRGPAFDGRIKPELLAFGADGSSGAAALVSGTVALLQQSFKEKHNGNYPSVHLVKAILVNTADDIESKYVDYVSGFGSLNTYKAVETIVNNQIFEEAVRQDEVKTFEVFVPANTAEAKFTLAWTDTPAIANAVKALMNDLDFSIRSSATEEVWLPWILSPYPHIDSLQLPARRGRDTLNNVEQITIELPQAGSYTVAIKGRKIATASQDFAVTWLIDTANSFSWTYPTPNDPLRAGTANVLRWQTNKRGTAKLQYSMDSINWITAADSIELSKQYFQWSAPDTLAHAQLRLLSPDNLSFVSDQFILSKPIDLHVGFNCPDSLLLYWNKLPVDQYQLYQLGEKYLEPVIATKDTFAVLKKAQYHSPYYAVSPVLDNSSADRSITINYSTQGVECYLKNFLVSLQNNTGLLEAELGSLYNVSLISFQKINTGDTQTIKSLTSTGGIALKFSDLALTKGMNSYRLEILLTNGTKLYSPIESLYFFTNEPVLIYPNPARQNEPVHLIVKDPFVYSIKVFDVAGRLLHTQNLNDLTNEMPTIRLSKGFYFIKIFTESGDVEAQKLIVH